MKKFKKSFFMITGLAGLLSVSNVVFASSSSFSDVNSSNPYAAYIQDLHEKGVVEGTADEKFNPTGSITRAEFVQLLVKSMKIPLDTNHFHFTDLNGNSAASYVQTAWTNGLVFGTTDTTFSPDAPIKREAAATMVWRYLKAHGVSSSIQNFMLPNTVDQWAREGVAQAMNKKLWGVPFTFGTYQSAARREEAAALIDIANKIVTSQTLLTVTREDPLHQFKDENFSITINNEEQITKLLSMLKNLPEFPKGTIHCPMDSGVTYKLNFIDAKINATVEASGCQKVTYDNKDYWGVDQKSNEFMSYLMNILGVNSNQFIGK